MATLTGNTIASTYTGLLSVTGPVGTVTLESVTDGAGTATSLSLSQQKAKIVLGTDSGDDFTINNGSADIVLVEGDANNVSLLNDLKLISDSSVITMGAGADATFTHDGTTGLTIAASPISINSTGDLTLDSSTDIVLDAAGGNIEIKDGGVLQLSIDLDTTAGDIDIDLEVDGDDLVFNQYDGTEVMRITDTVRVGITEASPDTKLHLSDATSGVWTGLRFESTNKDGFTFIDFKGLDNADYLDNPNGIRWLKGSDTTYMYIGQPYDDGVLTDDSFMIGSNYNENDAWVYIHAGDVRIGTVGDPAVDAKFHIEDTGDPSLQALIKATALTDTDYASFTVKGTGNSVENEIEIGVMYEASPTGGTNAPTGYIKLDPSDGASAYIWVDDSNNARISATRTHIGSTSGTVIGAQSSDERLKDISSDAFPYGLSQVNAMTPIKYQFKDDSENVDRLGFGAQTMKSIVPESVHDTKQCINGYDVVEETETNKEGHTRIVKKTDKPKSSDENQLAMEYVQLIPVLTKAVQELSASNDALKARIEVLEAA